MPHVNVKLFPGRTEELKRALAKEFVKSMSDVFGTEEWAVSVAFEEVDQEAWEREVVMPELRGKKQLLYKEPGYIVEDGKITPG